MITWWYGIPSSSSHTLIGGFAGAAIAHSGFSSINWSLNGGISLTIIFILLRLYSEWLFQSLLPLVTIQRNFWLKISIIITVVTSCLVFIHFKKPFEFWGLLTLGVIFHCFLFYQLFSGRNSHAVPTICINGLQLVSSATFSIGHGGSDAQKVIGIIGAAMVAQNLIPDISHIPAWVPFVCYTAIGLGTMSGGWRIVKTMGTRITKVTPLGRV